MITIVLMIHAAVWMNFESLEYLYPGDTAYICDAQLSDPGPKDSMIFAWCAYEPWMEHWIDSGEGVYIEAVARDRKHRNYRRQ